MKIVLSETLSYCVGVRQTLDLVDRLRVENPDKTYVMLGEIVHNERVIADLKARGLRFIDTIDEAPPDAVVVLQSHGSPLSLYRELESRGLAFVDATCPMVTTIHRKIRAVEKAGRTPVIIGQKGHDEVRGIAGQVARALIVGTPREVTPGLVRGVRRAGVVVQSTFVREDAERILERLRALVPDVVFHDTICRPTKARQREVVENSRIAGSVIVIGSKRSANTLHLHRLARKANPRAFLIDDPVRVETLPLPPGGTVFVASGASTPMDLILDVVRRLKERDR